MTKIKICGIKDKPTYKHLIKEKVDYIGFVFAKKSKRFVNINIVNKIMTNVDKQKTLVVGVFKDNTVSEILDITSQVKLDMIQLHDYSINFDNPTLLPEIRTTTVDRLKDDHGHEFLLIDNHNPGSGETFDWEVDISISNEKLFVAGGININNVTKAIDRFSPFAVDTSSGVESNGEKDLIKITKFIEEVRTHDTRISST